MCKWIEDRPNDWTYQLKCPKCGFKYSPKGNEDGTADNPYNFCPKCGEELDKPNYHIDKEELQKTKEEIKSHIASLIDELMQR